MQLQMCKRATEEKQNEAEDIESEVERGYWK
jgi:hypothetical protein